MGIFDLNYSGQSPSMSVPTQLIPDYGMNYGAQQSGMKLGTLAPGLDNLTGGMATAGGAAKPGSIWDNFLNTKETPGWGGMAMNAMSGIASAYMGLQQYGLARDTLNQHKQEYAANYDAQKRTTNASLEDRQRARVASNAGAYQSVGDYMSQNGIK